MSFIAIFIDYNDFKEWKQIWWIQSLLNKLITKQLCLRSNYDILFILLQQKGNIQIKS